MKKIVLYTLSTCPWCRKTKQFLKEKGIPFDYTDYDLTTEDVQQKIEKEVQESGFSLAFPYAKINGDVIVGYNPQKLSELLGVK